MNGHTVRFRPSASTQRTLISVDAMAGATGPANRCCRGVCVRAQESIIALSARPCRHAGGKRWWPSAPNLKGLHHSGCQGVVTMDDKPATLYAIGKDTSMCPPSNSVRNKRRPLRSKLGNTGALMALSMIRPEKLPGVNPPCHCRALFRRTIPAKGSMCCWTWCCG